MKRRRMKKSETPLSKAIARLDMARMKKLRKIQKWKDKKLEEVRQRVGLLEARADMDFMNKKMDLQIAEHDKRLKIKI